MEGDDLRALDGRTVVHDSKLDLVGLRRGNAGQQCQPE